MYKLCKTDASARRQRELEAGLLRAMSKWNYEEITVSKLCQEMDIPRKSFYRYFSGKDGALHALIDHTLMDFGTFEEPAHGTVPRPAHYGLEQFFGFWFRQRPLLDVLANSGLSGVLIERAIGHALQERIIPKFFLSAKSRAIQDHIITFLMCGLMSMVVRWHFDGQKQSVSEMARIATDLLTTPLLGNVEHQ